MKKISFILAALVSLFFVGCGGSEGSVSADSTENIVSENSQVTDTVENSSPVAGFQAPPAFPEQY